jgi:hypothetical protein
MMVLGALILLLLPSVIHYSISGMSVEKTVRVIMELAGEFRSSGVYLLVSSEQATGGCWYSTVGLLSKDYTPTAIMSLERVFLSHFQSERPSVYVIQSAGMKDKPPLRKVDHFLGDNSCKSNMKYAKFLEEFYEK